jgi:chorismate mutase
MQARSLEEVRDKIDHLDRKIIRLMAERSSFVKQGARFKT